AAVPRPPTAMETAWPPALPTTAVSPCASRIVKTCAPMPGENIVSAPATAACEPAHAATVPLHTDAGYSSSLPAFVPTPTVSVGSADVFFAAPTAAIMIGCAVSSVSEHSCIGFAAGSTPNTLTPPAIIGRDGIAASNFTYVPPSADVGPNTVVSCSVWVPVSTAMLLPPDGAAIVTSSLSVSASSSG